MSQTIEAIYENGLFKPLAPVDLPEGARVRVEAAPEATPLEEELRQLLLANGATPERAEAILDNLRLVWGLYDSLTPEQQAIYDQSLRRQEAFSSSPAQP